MSGFAAPGDFAAAIRDGGGAQEWLWKGNGGSAKVTVEKRNSTRPSTFGSAGIRVEGRHMRTGG